MLLNAWGAGLFAPVGMLLSALPFLLLFYDYRKRIRIPVIYVVAFLLAIGVVLPILIKAFGLWLALLSPICVLVYCVLQRPSPRK